MSIEDDQAEVSELFHKHKDNLPANVVEEIECHFDEWSEAYDEDVDSDCLREMLAYIVENITATIANVELPWFMS